MSTLRHLLRHLLRVLLPSLIRLSRRLAPRRRTAVVCGGPGIEGNAVETVRALLDAGAGRVVWLDPPPAAFCAAQGLTGFVGVRRNSLAGLWHYLSAASVFYTHGLYSTPRTVPGKLTVNLWHGSGMKAMPPGLLAERTARGPGADVLVSAARIWGAYYAGLCELPLDRVALTGNPRVDAFARPATSSDLADLGIEGRFVLWMPTFRSTAGADRAPGWTDAPEDPALERAAARLARELTGHGISLVVKAHPLDRSSRAVPGAVVVDDAHLERLGLQLYQLLAAADGLVSDASSVWTDYLLLDRPIGFLFADRTAYVAGRGVHPPDILEHLPGPFLDDEQAIVAFAEAIAEDASFGREQRRATADLIGLAQPPAAGAASGLLSWLAQEGRHPRY